MRQQAKNRNMNTILRNKHVRLVQFSQLSYFLNIEIKNDAHKNIDIIRGKYTNI